MSEQQQDSFSTTAPNKGGDISNFQDTRREKFAKKTSTFEALVKVLTRKDSRPYQKDELSDEPGTSPRSGFRPPRSKSLQSEEDTATALQIPNDDSIPNGSKTAELRKEDNLPDPADDNDWEVDLDPGTSPGHQSEDNDSDGVIDENGVGIIWHTERQDGPNDRETDRRGDKDFLYVDVFSADMYFRAMSLRAGGPASYKSGQITSSDSTRRS